VGVGKTSLELLRSKGRLRGLESAGESELLALVIGARNSRSAGAIAQDLMDSFGGLTGVGSATVEELMALEGIGPVASMRLKASFELGKRCVLSAREDIIRKVRAPEDVATLMIPEMRGLDREHFKAILLDTKNGIRKIVSVAVGSLNAALVHPRELFKAAVAASAAGIILVHNHPTGSPEPSAEDTELTIRFVKCGELMGIELVDHIVIGGDRFVSMRERGVIA
jgi:DNA repair protein RadC